jgi:hypothetical protein
MDTRSLILLTSTLLSLAGFVASRADDSLHPPGPLSDNPTVAEVSYALGDRSLSAFTTITPKNRAAVESILRRIAARADTEVAQTIDPGSQSDQTSSALHVLAAILNDPSQLAYFQRFFGSFDGTAASVAHEPYAKVIIEWEKTESYWKERMLKSIAYSAMGSYARFARRMGMDDAATPSLLQKLESRDDDIARNAALALGDLQTSAVVKYIEARAPAEEAKMPRGPYDPKLIEALQEQGITALPESQRRKTGLYLQILMKMKTAEARTAASAMLDRWEAIYKNHPQRDDYLTIMQVAKLRDELVRTAGEVAVTEPAPSEVNRNSTSTTVPSVPSAPKAAPATLAATPAVVDSSSPSSGFLWTCAGVTVALLVGLLVFWKRRV